MKTAVFSCKGLGDGLLALIVAHNLSQGGDEVVTFHPFLEGMQPWFPHLPLSSFPALETLNSFDRFILVYEKSPWMQQVLTHCETYFPEKTSVLNPIATPNKDYPYWEVGKFDGKLTFAHNLMQFCRRELGVEQATKHNGITFPKGVITRKHAHRVILHPTSSRPGKNWPEKKFLHLAEELENQGYEPVFILTAEERRSWPSERFLAPEFHSLSDTATFIAESGGMIGNDSGIGHLASALGLPTVTICRSKMTARFWRPDWAPNALLLPSAFLPNVKFLRLRDRYWKHTITVSRVFTTYRSLLLSTQRR